MIHAKGPLLSIDVSDPTTSEEAVDDVLADFVGGRGVATKLAHDRIPFDADPFGPGNAVYLSTGPLQMSNMSFTGRMNLTGLSPLTDGLLSSNAGGYLSRNFADTGYSVVEVTGASDDLIGIHVTDDGIEFEEVSELVEAEVPEVTEYVRGRHDLDAEHLLAIGPAGENRVRYASVMTYDSRAFGRGGLGAVLGSKNVKFVSFSGDGDSRPDIDIDEEVASEIHREAATADDMMRRQGTNAGTASINENFSLPTRFFSEYSFEEVDAIDGFAVEEKKFKKAACSMCAFACKLPTRDEERGIETEGPEFETVFSLGSNQGIGDIVDIMQSNDLCDRYGMDTVSAGNAVAAYLAVHDEFGNAELAHELLQKIAFREEEGEMLAEGIGRFHSEIGVENWSVKGLEFAAHDGRVLHGQGLSYAVSNRGADHMYGNMLNPEYNGVVDPEGLNSEKVAMLIERENRMAIRDSGVFCAFGIGDYIESSDMARLLDTDTERLQAVGARVVELERHFNNKRGLDNEDDRLPYEIPGLEESIEEYYELRGWNPNGTVPDDAVASSAAD